MNNKNNDDDYHIRPAGRHLLTIGSDLIQDQFAAVVELVKNAYDADSPDVEITFKVSPDRQVLTLSVSDRGHGMSRDTVVNKWLVPSTDDKHTRKTSPKGRIMQGRKGIGRYAASILGDTLLLETITSSKEKTEVLITWEEFEKAEYLDDVTVLVNTTKANQPAGTNLTITGRKKYLKEWDHDQIKNLKFELKKLISPINSDLSPEFSDEDFQIFLHFINFYDNQKEIISEQIKPYPIIELFDYRISGTINAKGKGLLTYRNQRARNAADENIQFNFKESTGCGKLVFDIRIYDREVDAIDLLIKRGLRDDQGHYLGKLEARQLLNEYNGIGVYRNGFRIRPMGDSDFDWLKLNEKRIQDPSLRIGSNQVIGYVLIESEEKSHLQEKSARDGLRENQAYINLREIARLVITELENRRYIYRQKAGLSRKAIKVERELEKLFSFEDIKKGIRAKLTKSGVPKKNADEILEIIANKEDENNAIADDIRQTVAIYQGQATLGKIINVILHEGRKPLSYFKNQLNNLDYWAEQLRKNYSPEIFDEVLPIADGLGVNSKLLVDLFKRLDPLAAKKRGSKKEFNLYNALFGTKKVFENELKENNIDLKINCPKDITMFGWDVDMYVILTNLIDNSIYWMVNKKTTTRKIVITVSYEKELEFIDYQDTGPGIEDYLIESGVIFEPEFTTKPDGTGLGLAIAGEAAVRNNLELKALASNTGAYFRLQPKGDILNA